MRMTNVKRCFCTLGIIAMLTGPVSVVAESSTSVPNRKAEVIKGIAATHALNSAKKALEKSNKNSKVGQEAIKVQKDGIAVRLGFKKPN